MHSGTVFGIALSSGAATLCRLNEDGAPTAPETVNLRRGDAPGIVRELSEMLEVRCDDLAAIGIAVGGHVTTTNDVVIFAPQLITPDEDWLNVPIVTQLGDVIGLSEVYVENDVNCMAAQLRSWGAARDMESFAVVYLAPEIVGLGCGIYLNGTVLAGSTGGAGEIGHLVVQPGGARCRCGNRGCLQAVLSAENIAREVNWGKRGRYRTIREIRELVDSGNPVARRAFERGGKVLGMALANLINLVDPGNVILGGADELVRSGPDVFTDAMQASLERYSFSNLGAATRIWIQPLDVGTAAQGAAKLAYDKLKGV